MYDHSVVGGGIQAALAANRNVVCLKLNETPLGKSAGIKTTAAALQQEKNDHKNKEEEIEDPTED